MRILVYIILVRMSKMLRTLAGRCYFCLHGDRCGHCKKLAPEFEKAATVLKENDPPVTLAEVNNLTHVCLTTLAVFY